MSKKRGLLVWGLLVLTTGVPGGSALGAGIQVRQLSRPTTKEE